MHNTSIEAKIASLSNIQGIINRLADTSSKIKGIYITAMSAILTIVISLSISKSATEIKSIHFIFIALLFFIISISFLVLDTYYLHYERIMRKVYDAKANDKNIDGSEIKNYFDISDEYKKAKEKEKEKETKTDIDKQKPGKLTKLSPSKSQLIFYGIPFFLIETAIIIWWAN